MLEDDPRPRAAGEPALWYLKLGTASVLLGKSEQARRDLDTALASDGHAWVRGRARLELGKLADLAGDRAGAPSTNARSRCARLATIGGASQRPSDCAKRHTRGE